MSGGRARANPPAPLLIGAEWFPETPGGLNRTFRLLVTGLADAGARPSAVVVGPAADAPSEVEVVRPGALPLRMLRFAKAMISARRRSSVVDIHFALYGLVAVVVARLSRLPILVHFHGPWAAESAAAGERPGIRLGAKRALERAVYRSGAIHVVHTLAFERLLVERYGVRPWSVEIVPPAVELERFTAGSRREARARLGIPEGARVAMTVRRITPRMGIDDLLRAWSRLTDRGAQLLIAGRGPDRARLERIAAELGIEGNVRFLGAVPDDLLPDLYRAADVCVMPSRELEGFGLVVLEALACGTPVVVADAGGLPEAVAGLANDLIVPAGDDAALAARLKSAFDGSEPLPSPERCREFAERFSLARLIDEHRRLYEQLVSRPAAGRRVVYVDRRDGPSPAPEEVIAAVEADEGRVHVILRGREQLARSLQRAGVSVEVLPKRGASVVQKLRLARRLRTLKPDLVRSLAAPPQP